LKELPVKELPYPTKIQAFLLLIILAVVLSVGAGLLVHKQSLDLGAIHSNWTEIVKEEGPGLKGPALEILKEEGPGLRPVNPSGDIQVVKEEGPGLGSSEVQVVKEEGPGLKGGGEVLVVKEEGPGLRKGL
jgi:hypothetical protein